MYFNPSALGLILVVEVSLTDEAYQFNDAIVWFRPLDGWFYAASDSGCSCNSPFEWFSTLGDCEGPFTRAAAMDWMRERWAPDRARVIDAVERIRHFAKP